MSLWVLQLNDRRHSLQPRSCMYSNSWLRVAKRECQAAAVKVVMLAAQVQTVFRVAHISPRRLAQSCRRKVAIHGVAVGSSTNIPSTLRNPGMCRH